jgi:NADH:ubiquinone oxidoreductase subunit 2 (subunit N)
MKWMKQLFDDNNTINEKSVVGFIAFLMMVVALGVDIFTGFAGKEFVINEFIFDGFMVIVLGSFGIGSIDKFINAKKGTKSEEAQTEE